MKLSQKKSGGLARLKYTGLMLLIPAMVCISALSFSKSYGIMDLAPNASYQDTIKAKPLKKNKPAPPPVVTQNNQVPPPPPAPPKVKPIPKPIVKNIKFPPPVVRSGKETIRRSPPPPPPARPDDMVPPPPPLRPVKVQADPEQTLIDLDEAEAIALRGKKIAEEARTIRGYQSELAERPRLNLTFKSRNEAIANKNKALINRAEALKNTSGALRSRAEAIQHLQESRPTKEVTIGFKPTQDKSVNLTFKASQASPRQLPTVTVNGRPKAKEPGKNATVTGFQTTPGRAEPAEARTIRTLEDSDFSRK